MSDKPRTAMAPTEDGKSRVSPKTIAAAVIPAAVGLVAVLVWWAVTGELNRPELAIAITAVLTSVLTGLGAWLVQPGETIIVPVVDAEGRPNVGPATPV